MRSREKQLDAVHQLLIIIYHLEREVQRWPVGGLEVHMNSCRQSRA